jgi:zinc-binding in reverse transcriptase
LWLLNIFLKIKIFILLVKRNRILTKVNLAKKDWQGSVQCMFCISDEDTDYLFVSCPMVISVWNWIAHYNNFLFDGYIINDFWDIDCCIPLKDKYVVEFVRCVVLWVLWLERNKLCFIDKKLVKLQLCLGLKFSV